MKIEQCPALTTLRPNTLSFAFNLSLTKRAKLLTRRWRGGGKLRHVWTFPRGDIYRLMQLEFFFWLGDVILYKEDAGLPIKCT